MILSDSIIDLLNHLSVDMIGGGLNLNAMQCMYQLNIIYHQ